MTMSDDLLEDLKELAQKWEWKVENYIDSDVPAERTMSAQQHADLCDLERLIKKYENGEKDD